MELKVIENDSCVTIKIVGRLDTAASAAFATSADEVLAQAPKVVEFDCSEMEYVASSGLRTFLNTYKKLTSTGGELLLTHVRPTIMSVLKMTGFTSFLKITE